MDALSCEAVERAKAIIMGSMYRSVERMNRHITNGNLGSAASEQRLQIDLRRNFEHMDERLAASPEQGES